VKRASYTRRFTFLYVLLTSLFIVLVAVFIRIHSNRLHQQRIHERFLSIQNLLTSAYKQMPMDSFIPWLENSDLQAWANLNWNMVWLGPDLDIRWSIHPVKSTALPIQLIEEHRAREITSNGAEHCPHILKNRQATAIHLEALSRLDPEAGWLLLYSPLPRFFLDGKELWSTVGLLVLLLGGNFLLYQRLMRRQVRNIIESSGLSRVVPPPERGQTIEKWARRYASLASRKIEESKDQFDRLFEILQDGIFLVDSQNQILRANSAAAALLGEPLDTLIGRPISGMKEHIVLENFTSEIRITASYQVREVQLESNSSLCNIAGIPILEEEMTGPTAVMIILHDLTRLRQLERAGEEYAVNVSHELKTPLTLIQGFTETLLSHEDMEVEARSQALQTIERHAKRISRIIDDLLRLAWLKNEAYTLGIPRAVVPVANIINETVFMCDEWARNAGIVIKADAPEDLMWKLNSGLMEEALINLVKNAILYAIVGPVEIQARVLENGQLQFAVIDRGPGLKPEDAQHIFDRFYRADKSRTRASGGSGLGLPIVQQIVEAHNGTARVETAPGEGCTFILEIPPDSA